VIRAIIQQRHQGLLLRVAVQPEFERSGPFERFLAHDRAAAGLVVPAALLDFQFVLVGVVEEVVQAGEEPGGLDDRPLGVVEPDAGAVAAAVEGEWEVQGDAKAGEDARAARAEARAMWRLGRDGSGERGKDGGRADGAGGGSLKPCEMVVEEEKAAAASGAGVGGRLRGGFGGSEGLIGTNRAVHVGTILGAHNAGVKSDTLAVWRYEFAKSCGWRRGKRPRGGGMR
jgi:hypothetical protein